MVVIDASDPAVPGGWTELPPGCLKIPKLLPKTVSTVTLSSCGVLYMDFLWGLMDHEMVFPPAQSTQRQLYA